MAPPGGFNGVFMGARMRGLADRINRPGSMEPGGPWSPAVDIFETQDEVVLVVEMAGVKRKAVKVIVDGDVVRIYGNREPAGRAGKARYHRLEISTGAFTRSFRIHVPFDPKGVKANSEDGLLYVRLPKAGPQEPRKIAVESC